MEKMFFKLSFNYVLRYLIYVNEYEGVLNLFFCFGVGIS